MTGALYYPPADRTTQWYGSGNATVAPNKQLWHTTETAGGWPAYSGGASAPNLTYEPWQHRWRQHFPLNGTARALRNGTGYATNRQGVCQVEVSCYCDPARFSTGKGIDRLDNQAYDDMAAFAQFMAAEWGVPLFTGVAFLPYPESYGANGVRLSRAQFTAYRGHLDHMHAPDNTHGDAGTMDVPRIVAGSTPEPPPPEDDVAFTATGPNGQIWHLSGVWRRPISQDIANALSVLAAPFTVPYQGNIGQHALNGYQDVGGSGDALSSLIAEDNTDYEQVQAAAKAGAGEAVTELPAMTPEQQQAAVEAGVRAASGAAWVPSPGA